MLHTLTTTLEHLPPDTLLGLLFLGSRRSRRRAPSLLSFLLRPLFVLVVLIYALTALNHATSNNSGPVSEEESNHFMVAHTLDRALETGKTCYGHAKRSPGQFRYGDDGISTFDMDHLPDDRPCLVLFRARAATPPPYSAGTIAQLDEPRNCQITYTPEIDPGHWSLTCPGIDPEPTKKIVSDYAKRGRTVRGIVVDNPAYSPPGAN